MTDSRRFNSLDYLTQYVEHGRFPEIHDDLFNFILDTAAGERMCDLCGSTGLLGQRLLSLPLKVATHVCGIEMDHEAVAAGRDAGIDYPRLVRRIDQHSLGEVRDFLLANRVDTLVARRCFSEIFGYNPEFAEPFRMMLVEVGVKEVFLQGRQPVRNATHPMPTVAQEINVLLPTYTLIRSRGQLAYLRLL